MPFRDGRMRGPVRLWNCSHGPRHDAVMTETEDARRWFGTVEMEGGSAAAREVLSKLVAMLDALQPRLLDPARSTVRTQGHGWTVANSVEIHLEHATDEEAAVTIAVGPDEAIVSWIATHEHVRPHDGTAERPWTTVVVDATAAVLRGEYEVEHHYKGDRLVKTRIIDTADPEGERTLSTTGTLISSWLPSRRTKRVERRKIDYGVTGA